MRALGTASILGLLAMTSMGEATTVQGTVNVTRPSRSHLQDNRSLQRRTESAYEAARTYFADAMTGDNATENPLPSARAEWQARLARCSGEVCRHSLLTEELNRLRFPFRTGRQHLAHVRWRTGGFRIDYGDGGGTLLILPVIDDLILVRAVTSANRNAEWICDLTAYGRVRPNGSASMKAVGGDVRFTLTTDRRGEIILRPVSPEPNGPSGCPGRGSLWGRYRPHYGR